MSKTFFIDLTKCTACRGCQIACKQWKKLPAEQTENWGSHQNPKDLSGVTLKLVRFEEVETDDGLQWLFFPEQCRHCVEPPCLDAMTVPGSIVHDEETGAVVYTELTAKEPDKDAFSMACPYNIPRVNKETGRVVKCDMCIDRVKIGMLPACVQTCPTGCMNFGDRDEMLALAEKSLEKATEKFPNAELVDAEYVRVIYLVQTDPDSYYESLSSDASDIRRGPLSRKQFLASLARPIKRMRS
ncbi:MAG: 4Fe-4S dicluster domain-containing protein [Pseudodesulfovibrio sp.]|jgi:formate dehydrogenase iron-sulfur subunit|uniref:Formate dehydrogenase n=1 Tax=Pseudodesulfovibrio indicus TaxID=1716143 RepID=A0A126QRR0_9BACT|nr:4Fe-4S dicluster domain-containing protein [Pseudodesulfovibrio indicus]AMK12602.1 formate dehydrogenase [Pseudodesulfovibrio indicus]TDT90913.1 formate dehydrogenase iron-sulfur subunit [Pseudodesulfovibrio indicus]